MTDIDTDDRTINARPVAESPVTERPTAEGAAVQTPSSDNPWADDDPAAIAAIVEERLQEQRSRRGWRRFTRR